MVKQNRRAAARRLVWEKNSALASTDNGYKKIGALARAENLLKIGALPLARYGFKKKSARCARRQFFGKKKSARHRALEKLEKQIRRTGAHREIVS